MCQIIARGILKELSCSLVLLHTQQRYNHLKQESIAQISFLSVRRPDRRGVPLKGRYVQ